MENNGQIFPDSGILKITKPEVGKREQKKTDIRLSFMESFIRELEIKPLKDIRVNELCAKIGISKVTFFKYFSSRDQVVEYFIYKWSYEMSFQLFLGKLKGIDGIKEVFNSVSDHPAGKNIISALMTFYLNNQVCNTMQLTPYELYRFNPEAYLKGSPFLDLQGLFTALVRTRPNPPESIQDTVFNLISGFYGVSFVSGVYGSKTEEQERMNLKEANNRFIDAILST